MASLVKYKTMSLLSEKRELIEIEYDFAKDGGAVSAIDIFKAIDAMMVMVAYMKVKTTCTSGGSATVSVGKSGDAAGLVAATAVASLTAGAAIDGASIGSVYKLAADDVVQMDIAVAALTAGKIVFGFEVIKF